jgi:hypothetical protein
MCGMILGLMAISASGAQAGMWMVNGANVGVGVKLAVEIGVEIEPLGELKEKHVVLLTTSGGNNVEILCPEIKNVKGVVELEVITGTLNVNGCLTFINKKREANCDPLNQPVAAGGKITAVLHPVGGTGYGLAEGTNAGGAFLTFKFNEELCIALPPAVNVTGKLWIEDCNGKFSTELPSHLIQEGKTPAKELGGLFFGTNKASIDGSVNIKLVDEAHKEMNFSGLPE